MSSSGAGDGRRLVFGCQYLLAMAVRFIRTLAMLTGFLGAKLGANSGRYEATMSDVQPESAQVSST